MPTNTLYGASNPVAGNSSAPTNNWWQGTQFDQNGQFGTPGLTIKQTGNRTGATDQYGNSLGTYEGATPTYAVGGDQSFINSYLNGGRSIDQPVKNADGSYTMAFEMNPQQRQQYSMNNGRYLLNATADPTSGALNFDPNSMRTMEAAQPLSAGRAFATGILPALMGGAAALYAAPAAAGSAAGTGTDAAAMAGTTGATAASGGGAGAEAYGAGTEAMFGGAPAGTLGGSVGDVSGYTTGSSTNVGATAGNVGGYSPGSPSWFDTAKNAYNTYNRGRQVAGVGQRLLGGGTQGGGTMPVNNQSGVAQPQGVANAPGSSNDINWGDILGGAINGMGQANYGQNLRNPWQNNQNANAPYIQQLAQSYSDPNSYLKGPEFTAINNLYNNDITRKAAAGGTLGNDIDRQVKLQQFAMTNLGNYRTGLENVINNNQRNNAPYIPGNNAGLAAQAGALGAGTSAAGITNVGKGIYNIWDQLFGGKNTGNGGNSIPESPALDPSVFGGGGAPAAGAADVGQYAGDVGSGSDWSDLFGG